MRHKRDPQALPGQQQRKRAPGNAAAANTNVKRSSHNQDCRRQCKILFLLAMFPQPAVKSVFQKEFPHGFANRHNA